MGAAAELPFVDEHEVVVAAGPSECWAALLAVVEGAVSSGAAPRYARLLGCADVESAGPRPLLAGSSLPGFHVTAAAPAQQLALAGRHAFSVYALRFSLDPLGPGQTRVRAQTRAAFPGLRGRVYRALVVGTRMHAFVTRRLLAATRRRAERP